MKLTYDLNNPLRIDKYLACLDDERLYSRSLIEKLISANNIFVNGKQIKKNYLLVSGDEIEIDFPPLEEKTLIAQDIPLDLVYEDEYLAVINKPAGISVHPAPGNFKDTVANAILHRFGNDLPAADPIRPGIVHRLDKDTTGLLIIAKDDRTMSLLSKAFAEREISKNYLAIVSGIPDPPSGTITTKIGRSRSDRTKMVVKHTGRESVTEYRVLQTYDFFSLLDITLHTGRTHQIRVHMSYINRPVLGDAVYSRKNTLSQLPLEYRKKVSNYISKNMNRQALHAYKLKFSHPITASELFFEIPLPADMEKCLTWLKTIFGELILQD
jgi:23S rRNA pseudouridine1911/1915/1917 synthase